MLTLEELTAGYGGGTVLHGVGLELPPGSVHAVVGHNGAGKSTLVQAVAGLLRPSAGRVLLDGEALTGRKAHRVARAGIGLVPQGRRVFAGLTVAEHLRLAHRAPRGGARPGPGWTPERVYELLPRLAERRSNRGAQLSGGEQQMLALARALLGTPKVLLLDEPTEGLAPVIVEQIQALIRSLADEGVASLLMSPSASLAVACADQVTVLTSGRVTDRFDGEKVRAEPALLEAALALTTTPPPGTARSASAPATVPVEQGGPKT